LLWIRQHKGTADLYSKQNKKNKTKKNKKKKQNKKKQNKKNLKKKLAKVFWAFQKWTKINVKKRFTKKWLATNFKKKTTLL
jgi:hypothetical protein